jgi:hypothetical protein
VNIKEGTPIHPAGSLHNSEVGSIEVIPQVSNEMWPENIRKPFFLFLESPGTLNGLMLKVQIKMEPSYL